jgi:hypothetical protein
MRKQALVEFTHPRKPALEELLLIDHNLEEVVRSIEELLSVLGRRKVSASITTSQSITARSLYCFAAISYMRCFAPGYRTRLEISKIPHLSFLDRRLHDNIRAIRNKYLAHAINSDHEGTHLFLVAPNRNAEATHFTILNAILVSDSRATLGRFIRLVGKVRKYIQTRVTTLGNEVARDVFGPRATWRKLSIGDHHASNELDA